MRAVSALAIGLASIALIGCNGGPEGPPTLSISTTELDFGNVPVQTDAEQTFTVTNTGADEFEVLSVSLVAGDFDLWDVTREGPAVLTFDDTLTVTVVFSPDAEVDEIGQVQIRTDISGTGFVDLIATGSSGTQDEDNDGFSPADGDCNDSRDDVYPGAPELCDGRDNNCDDTVPSNESDGDSDGFRICEDDCDDGDANVYPGAPEICDDKDSNCDSINSDRTDRDGDNQTVCEGDCDDGEALAYDGAAETCGDQIDNDCDGLIDIIDADNDGHSLCGDAGDCDDNNSTIYPLLVDASGVSPGDGTEATPYTDLDDAISNVLATCPEIHVAAGTYEVSSAITSGTFTIYGQGVSSTILDAPDDDRHLTISGGADITLSNVTISGGAPLSGDGGAIDVNDATLTLVDCEVRDNVAPSDGGAVVVSNGVLNVDSTRFTLNTAGDDGGAVALFSSTMVGANDTYTNNGARDGGALLASSSDISLTGSTIAGNSADRQGGGINVLGATSASVVRARVAQNTATTGGGGISMVNASGGSILNCQVQDNAGGTTGGGILISGTSGIEVRNNTVVANDATSGGGGIAVVNGTAQTTVHMNILQANGGTSGLQISGAATASYNTAWQNTGVPATEFAGASDGVDDNIVRNPVFVAFSDNGNPADDDLALAGNSPEIDAGNPDSAYNDTDTTTNDRGHTGGPQATP